MQSVIACNGRKTARLTTYDEDCRRNEGLGFRINEGSVAYEVPPRKVTFEEFLEIRDNTEQRLEYINGMIYLLASPKTTHQTILGDLFLMFSGWFRGKKCKPIVAPYDITLKKKNGEMNMVQPDLMVICDLKENLNEKDYYTGVPVLVMEIISEGTRSKDFIEKMDLYMYSGVREYWIVNPINKDVVVFYFEENKIKNNMTFKAGEKAVSSVFDGLGADVGSIFG